MFATLSRVSLVRLRCPCLPLLVLERCAQTGRMWVGLLLFVVRVSSKFLFEGYYRLCLM